VERAIIGAPSAMSDVESAPAFAEPPAWQASNSKKKR
jgi:hypothetical protein